MQKQTEVIDALDDIFLKIQKKLVFWVTYKEWPHVIIHMCEYERDKGRISIFPQWSDV